MIEIICEILLGLLGVVSLMALIMLFIEAAVIYLGVKEEFKNSSDNDKKEN